jgi:Zincin-like metallopeptidase
MYLPELDQIRLPWPRRFTSAEAFCATSLHETVHWTGHASRLNRQFGKRFGDAAYAFEELVAELGSAFLMGHCGGGAPIGDASFKMTTFDHAEHVVEHSHLRAALSGLGGQLQLGEVGMCEKRAHVSGAFKNHKAQGGQRSRSHSWVQRSMPRRRRRLNPESNDSGRCYVRLRAASRPPRLPPKSDLGPIEQDLHFRATRPLSACAREARMAGRIQA